MASATDHKSEVTSWLEVILEKENLQSFSVEIQGNSNKNEGYCGDIVFVEVNGITQEGLKKDYSIVLKCAKRSAALREKAPIKEAFLNEIFFYETIFPQFLQFQNENHIDNPFNKVPKFYGTLVKGEMEVLALENLKKKGYFLWDRKQPLTRKHINLIIEEYAKFHSVSIAMKQQKPKEFEDITSKLDNILAKFEKLTHMSAPYEKCIDEVCDLLKDELDEGILTKCANLKNDVSHLFTLDTRNMNVMNVILHGDCWNNNFLQYHNTDGLPSTFAMLDWQVTRYSCPVLDVSYFLFACLSEEDIDDLDSILEFYHKTLMKQLRKFQVANAEKIYPFEQFLNEWRRFCKFGILINLNIHKYAYSETDDVPDMAEAADRGEDIASTFAQPIKNVEQFKNRIKYIIRYVGNHNLI